MRFFALLGFMLVLAGCADSHTWTPQQNGSGRIAANDRILISTPDAYTSATLFKSVRMMWAHELVRRSVNRYTIGLTETLLTVCCSGRLTFA